MTEPVFPSYDPTVGNAVADAARRRGDHDFLVTADERITYSELDRRSKHLAARLITDGVGKGTKVAVLFANGPAWVTCWAAITRIGAVMVPVTTFYKARELGRLLRHADVAYLVGVPAFLNNDYAKRLEEIAPELAGHGPGPLYLPSLPQLRGVFFWADSPVTWARGDYGTGLDDEPATPFGEIAVGMEADVTPADPMMLMYTSGSTADPKGVLHSHGATTRHAANLDDRSKWQETYRMWTPAPLFWIGGFHNVMYRCLVAGTTLITQATADPSESLVLLAAERVTHVLAWPASTKAIVELPEYAETDLSSIIAGTMYEALPPARRPLDPSLLCESLGMTETCGPHSGPTQDEDVHGVPPEYRGTHGRTIPGIEVRIADFVTGEFLSDGEEGEVVVRGYSVMLGLHKKERADTFDADGWYHTADRGFFRDGWLFFTARQSDMIKTSGSNVAPAEAETLLVSYPEVMRAFVFGVPHPTRGQDVVALVVPWSDGAGGTVALDTDDLVARLRSQLSSFKVPRRIHMIADEDVVWLPSQKPDRRSLNALAEKLDVAAAH